MPEYTVRIETSVSIEADSPEQAAFQAQVWADESLTDSNGIAKVYQYKKGKLKLVLRKEL